MKSGVSKEFLFPFKKPANIPEEIRR